MAEQDQAAFWNERAGRTWVEAQDLIDDLFRPLEELLAEAVEARPARRVLDVGCGTGATTVAAARRLGEAGECTGVDVSAPMVEAAQARARKEGVGASFVLADAATHAFEPASFDLLISRFGVMFFADPVAAFANLRRAAGELRLLVWRSRDENPFMTAAERAVGSLLDLPASLPGAPGQWAFADADRVSGILAGSGWTAIEIEPVDFACTMPESQLLSYATRLGPVGRALPSVDEETRARVTERLRPAYDPFVEDGQVRFAAACWSIGAWAGG